MLYPMSILNGEGAKCEFTAISFAGEGQNLDRTRTQLKLVADMEAKKQQMDDIVKEIINEYK